MMKTHQAKEKAMKFKLFPLIAGVAALSFAVSPLAAQAQEAKPFVSQFQEVMQEIGVTEEQKAEFEQLRQSTRNQIATVLTEEQKQTLKTAILNGEGPMAAMKSLNLTEEQRTEVRSILQSARQEGSNILTEEQKQELREEIRERVGNNGGLPFRGR